LVRPKKRINFWKNLETGNGKWKNFDRVQQFKYLGGAVTEDNEISEKQE
jgi:hypothetical protein